MSKIRDVNQHIEKVIVEGYQKFSETVVGGYQKIEDKFVDTFLKHDGETVEEAKKRIQKEQQERENIERGNSK